MPSVTPTAKAAVALPRPTSPSCPSSCWPQQVADEYKYVRALGKGAFGSVVLAKRKRQDPSASASSSYPSLVAIKAVATNTRMQSGYAHREISILQELSHPNIMGIIDSWEPSNNSTANSAAIVLMALTYSPGPTLQAIFQHGGAPSLTFGRVIIAQIVDAVAYLHSKAVIHRDIKPDNFIVTGADLEDEDVWVDSDALKDANWASLLKRWKVTLIDFGFARALSRKDMERDVGLQKSMSMLSLQDFDKAEAKAAAAAAATPTPTNNTRGEQFCINQIMDTSTGNTARAAATAAAAAAGPGSLDRSVSKRIVRKLSALGNRTYAAPEILNGVREDSSRARGKSFATRHALSNYVADYGMVADAYSLGATCRYILTGVPPGENVDEFIAVYNSGVAKAARWIGKKLQKKKNNKKKKRRAFTYRSSPNLPKEAIRMVRGLTHGKPSERTTVRAARLYPYVDDVLGGDAATPPMRYTVEFLGCAEQPAMQEQPL